MNSIYFVSVLLVLISLICEIWCMGTQTMGSNGETRKSMLDGLSRQGSLYNLTLDEVQQQLGDLGKPFNSMNLDELLKNVYGAEGNQGMSGDFTEYKERGSGSMELRKKTVDEVWQDIQLGQKKKKKKKKDGSGGDSTSNVSNNSSFKDGERKPTLGEMTLEDFLVKAGVVAECSSEKKNEEQNLDLRVAPWMNYQVSSVQQQQLMVPGSYQVPQNLSVIGNHVMDGGFMSPTPLMGTLSDAHMAGRKRYSSGAVVERTVERRQKRMIKNRESAARSRARKQV